MQPADSHLTCVVRQVTQEADLIRSYELVDPEGHELPRFAAGAHVDLRIDPRLSAAYSICSDPAERYHYRIAVKRNVSCHGVSARVHDQLTVGSRVTCSMPRNTFTIEHPERAHILIAGGIGVTPLLAMLYELTRRSSPVRLFFCARSSRTMPFVRLLSEQFDAGTVDLHYSMQHGRLNLQRAVASLPAADIYVCGPRSLIDATLAVAPDSSRVRYELFESAASGSLGTEFECVLARSGRVLRVSAEQTLLEALRTELIDIQSQCGLGVCGTCAVRYVDGVVDHRDEVLTAQQQQDWMIPCISRALSSRITLDL